MKKYRKRARFTEAEKAKMWDRWQRGDSLHRIARLLDGEKMAPLCREFGISRKTDYKIFNRYKGLGLEGLTDRTITVTKCGRICFNQSKVNFSIVFAGQNVGVKQVDEGIWVVSFMHYDLGYFDLQSCKITPVSNPFSAKVLPMSPE